MDAGNVKGEAFGGEIDLLNCAAEARRKVGQQGVQTAQAHGVRRASVLAALNLAEVVFQRPLEGFLERKIERRSRSLARGHAPEKRVPRLPRARPRRYNEEGHEDRDGK